MTEDCPARNGDDEQPMPTEANSNPPKTSWKKDGRPGFALCEKKEEKVMCRVMGLGAMGPWGQWRGQAARELQGSLFDWGFFLGLSPGHGDWSEDGVVEPFGGQSR